MNIVTVSVAYELAAAPSGHVCHFAQVVHMNDSLSFSLCLWFLVFVFLSQNDTQALTRRWGRNSPAAARCSISVHLTLTCMPTCLPLCLLLDCPTPRHFFFALKGNTSQLKAFFPPLLFQCLTSCANFFLTFYLFYVAVVTCGHFGVLTKRDTMESHLTGQFK